jgi:hypothetical protein
VLVFGVIDIYLYMSTAKSFGGEGASAGMAESLAASVADDNAAGMNGIYSNGKHFYLDNGGGPLLLPASSFSNKSADAKPRQRRSISRPGPDAEDIIHLLHGSDPVKVELNRLENEVRGKPSHHTETHRTAQVINNACGSATLVNALKAVFLCSRLQGIPSNKGELKKMACDFHNAHCTIALDSVSRSGRLTVTLKGYMRCSHQGWHHLCGSGHFVGKTVLL